MLLNLAAGDLAAQLLEWLASAYFVAKALLAFSAIIFVHELGHFLAAKWTGTRVDRFAVGLGPRVCGYRAGEGFTFGASREFTPEELTARGLGETDYCLKALPIGGYVKMLGEDDIIIDEATGEMKPPTDPRAFTNRRVESRMLVVSSGVVFNLLFAALLLMAVFLIGQKVIAPIVGIVEVDSPANGKLMTGDRVLAVNGTPIYSYIDLRLATAFAHEGESLDLLIERNEGGQDVQRNASVTPRMDEKLGMRTLDVQPMLTTVRTRDSVPAPGHSPEENVLLGDKIIAVDGQPVRMQNDVLDLFARSGGRVLPVTVLRPDPKNPSAPPREVTCYQRALIALVPSTSQKSRQGVSGENILGMMPRRIVDVVEPGSPAAKAGLQRGDVFASCGAIANPTYDEIITTIRANAGVPIPVVVERNGEMIQCSVTPKRAFSLWTQEDARIGVGISRRVEELTPRVSMVVPDTPAAKAGLPRGALITQIDGAPVANWFDVVERLRAAAGHEVEVRYVAGGDEVATRLDVPLGIESELGMPPGAVVWSATIEDDEAATTTRNSSNPMTIDAKPQESTKDRGLTIVDPDTLQDMLERNIGKVMTIRYSSLRTETPVTARFRIKPENTDPWQSRVLYFYDPYGFELAYEMVDAGGNPLQALYMGGRLVFNQVYQGYQVFSRMLTREVSTQHISGPVGIFDAAIQSAKLSVSEMLHFMAMLSISLAVINFMPIPLMDGGQMVFLIIEKVKGKPLSFRTQMISSLIGLAGILLIGLLVTIQDISRLFQ